MTLDHHDEATAQAMRVVARAIIALGAREYLRETQLLDEMNPYDASDVRRIVVELAQSPPDRQLEAALEHLIARVETP